MSYQPTDEEARAKIAESGGVLTLEQARAVLKSQHQGPGDAAAQPVPEAPAPTPAPAGRGGKK